MLADQQLLAARIAQNCAGAFVEQIEVEIAVIEPPDEVFPGAPLFANACDWVRSNR